MSGGGGIIRKVFIIYNAMDFDVSMLVDMTSPTCTVGDTVFSFRLLLV